MSPKTFALAWLDAVAAAPISTSAKAVALVMATHANYSTGAGMRAGNERLAAMAGLSVRQVRRCIGDLRAAQLVTWDGNKTAPGVARTYQLTIPNGGHGCPPLGGERGTWVSSVGRATGDNGDRNGGQKRPERGTPVSSQHSQNMARTSRAIVGAPDGRRDEAALPILPHPFRDGCCPLPETNTRAHLVSEVAS